MPSRKKINVQKVLASLNLVCPKCQAELEPRRSCASILKRSNAHTAIHSLSLRGSGCLMPIHRTVICVQHVPDCASRVYDDNHLGVRSVLRG